MKNLQILTVAVLSLLMGVACSKLNNMMDMADKMDHTNEKMDNTYQQIQATNSEIKKTNKAVHDQTLMVALKEIEKIENADKLFPVPTSILPYAKAFAEEAKESEIVELTYAWIKDITEVAPMGDLDENQQQTVLKDKLVHLYGLYSIASFIPDEMLNTIIETHIQGSSRFEETAMQILMMRVIFTRDVLLKESILAKSISNAGTLEEAIKYMDKVDFIMNLPYASDLSLRLFPAGVKMEEPLVNESLNADGMKKTAAYWTKINNNATQGLKEFKAKSWTGDAAKDAQKLANEQNRFSVGLSKVQQKMNEWAAKLP